MVHISSESMGQAPQAGSLTSSGISTSAMQAAAKPFVVSRGRYRCRGNAAENAFIAVERFFFRDMVKDISAFQGRCRDIDRAAACAEFFAGMGCGLEISVMNFI